MVVSALNRHTKKSHMHPQAVSAYCLMVPLEFLMFKTHNLHPKANQLLIINLKPREDILNTGFSTFLSRPVQLFPCITLSLFLPNSEKHFRQSV